MLNIGIAGLGFMGMIHYLAYEKLKGVKVAAVCETDAKKLAGDWRSIKGNFGPAGTMMDLSKLGRYSELEKLLADPKIDCVDICLPPAAHALFFPAWLLAAVVQPINALSFVTDGIHWGTGDFRYLRNAMFVATGAGALGLWGIEAAGIASLLWVWIVTDGWIVIRSAAGVLRVWPGIGAAPLAQPDRTPGLAASATGRGDAVPVHE